MGVTALFIVCSGKIALRAVFHTWGGEVRGRGGGGGGWWWGGGVCGGGRLCVLKAGHKDSECKGPGEDRLEGSCEAGAEWVAWGQCSLIFPGSCALVRLLSGL